MILSTDGTCKKNTIRVFASGTTGKESAISLVRNVNNQTVEDFQWYPRGRPETERTVSKEMTH